MPRIPDATDVNRTAPSGEQGVARFRGGAGAARALGDVGSAVEGYVDAQAQYQASKAKSELLVAQTKIENEDYSEVPYDKLEEQYEEKFREARDKIADQVSNPLARQEFQQQAEITHQRGLGEFRDMARRKEIDVERANTQTALQGLRETAVNGKVLEASEEAQNIVDAAVEQGYYGAEEGQQALQKWKQDAAAGRLRMLDPERRLSALEQPWAENLPDDRRAQLRRDAREATRATRAQVTSESYREQGLSRLQALKQADSIADPETRDAVRRRVNTDYDRSERNQDEAQNNLYEDIARRMDMDKVAYEDVPDEQKAALTARQRDNLQSISQSRYQPRQRSDPDLLIELSAAASAEDWQRYNRLIKEQSHLLTPDDRVKYTTKGIDKQLPEDAETGLTDVQAASGVIAEAGIEDDNAKSIVLNKLGRWRRRETERTGKKPSDRERDEYLDYLVMQKNTDWGSDPAMYEREPEEQVRLIQEQEPDVYDTVREYFANQGITNPTPQQFIDVYATRVTRVSSDSAARESSDSEVRGNGR